MHPLRFLGFLRMELRAPTKEGMRSNRSLGHPFARVCLASFQMPSSGLSSGA